MGQKPKNQSHVGMIVMMIIDCDTGNLYGCELNHATQDAIDPGCSESNPLP
jgi:hypothetical protein